MGNQQQENQGGGLGKILAVVRAAAAKAVSQSLVRAIPPAVNPSRVRAILATQAVAATSSGFKRGEEPGFRALFYLNQ